MMNSRIGKHVTQTITQESYKAYVPPQLPPIPPVDLSSLYLPLEQATRSVAELNRMCKSIPNISLFIYMYVRKEALLSSQIEGTQSSFSDLMLFENHRTPQVSVEDVEEVSNYVKAITYGLARIRENFPLSLRLLREIHGVLLAGGRGAGKLPGEFRRSQNWIGGTRPGNALFVPPPPDYLPDCLSNFEHFLHDHHLPILIKIGLAHVQFETIHPFLDGNGRLGRLLMTLLLCVEGVLEEPVLYLSLYLKQNRSMYYERLQEVRTHGTWETWLEFFLKGMHDSAKQAMKTAGFINDLFEHDQTAIAAIGRGKFSCHRTLEYMKRLPQVTVPFLAAELNMTAPTARRSLESMVELGILEEMTGKKRDKIYIYRRYLNILEEGTEL
jgi:Fic family protein